MEEQENLQSYAPSKDRVRAFLERARNFQSEANPSHAKAGSQLALNTTPTSLELTGIHSLPSQSPKSLQGSSFNFSKIAHGGPSSMKITHRFLQEKKDIKDGQKIIEFQMEEEDGPQERAPFHSQPTNLELPPSVLPSSTYTSRNRVESDMTSRATSPINLPPLDENKGFMNEGDSPEEKQMKDRFIGVMKNMTRGRQKTPSPNLKTFRQKTPLTERVKFSGLIPGSFKARSKSPALSIKNSAQKKGGLKASASQLLPNDRDILSRASKRPKSKLNILRSKSKESSPKRKKSKNHAAAGSKHPGKSLGPSKSQNSFLIHETETKRDYNHKEQHHLFKGEDDIKPIERIEHNISLASMEQDLALLNGGSGRIHFASKVPKEENTRLKTQETAKFRENFQSEKKRQEEEAQKAHRRQEPKQEGGVSKGNAGASAVIEDENK